MHPSLPLSLRAPCPPACARCTCFSCAASDGGNGVLFRLVGLPNCRHTDSTLRHCTSRPHGETTARSTPSGCFDARLCRSDERRRAALRLRAATWGTMRLYVAVILAYAASGKFSNFLRRIHEGRRSVSKLCQLKRLWIQNCELFVPRANVVWTI